MKIKEAIFFFAKKIESNLKINSNISKLESRLLIQKVLNQTLEYITINSSLILSDKNIEEISNLVERRLKNEPISYIIGKKEFYGLEFLVNKDCLIPRPETELIVEFVIFHIRNFNRENTKDKIKIIDLGAGSGCISISILNNFLNVKALATDISYNALLVAKKNSIIHKVDDRIDFVISDWFSSISSSNQKFDYIICNPPYIANTEKSYISKETILHEPNIALFAEQDGMFNYENIASNARNYMKNNSLIILEVGFSNSEKVINIFEKNDFKIYSILPDLSGYNRCLIFSL